MKNIIYSKVKVVAMTALLAAPFLTISCIEDNGNYDYVETPEITITGIPEVTEALAHIDNIKMNPIITSSTEGQITPDNPNFTIQYRLGHKGMGSMGVDSVAMKSIAWKDVTPASGFNLDTPADYNPGLYLVWLTLTDNRTGVVTSKQYDVSIGSTTYEGWLVLCNEGAEEKVRLDMISRISATNIQAAHNVCAGLPNIHHATTINMFPSNGGEMALFSREGAYALDMETLETSNLLLYNNMYFAIPNNENIIHEDLCSGSTYSWLNKYQFCFSDQGNIYLKDNYAGGASFGVSLATLQEGTPQQFRVAPAMACTWIRPWPDNNFAPNILFYDIDNLRFLMFMGSTSFSSSYKMQLYTIPDPGADEPRFFSYNTGRNFVYMEGTRRSGGLSYTILEDPATHKRSIYGINLGGTLPVQEMYIENVDAPGFSEATQFAFHSQFPLMFYSVGSKLYLYNLATHVTTEMNTGLGADDQITKLKFNLYRASDYTELANQSEEFMAQQYRLIVCTCNSDLVSGGKVTFYNVDGVNNTVTKGEQYTGFAKPVDIRYREREI